MTTNALVWVVGGLATSLLMMACQAEADVHLDCPTEPGDRIQVGLFRYLTYTIEGDCPEADDCIPSREQWTYTTDWPLDGAGDIRFYAQGDIRESVTFGYNIFDPFCCPTQSVEVVGIRPGIVTLILNIKMSVDGRVGDYSDRCEVPVVVLDLRPIE